MCTVRTLSGKLATFRREQELCRQGLSPLEACSSLNQIRLARVLFLSLPLKNSTPREGRQFPRKYCVHSWLVISPLVSSPALSSLFFLPPPLHSPLSLNSKYQIFMRTDWEGREFSKFCCSESIRLFIRFLQEKQPTAPPSSVWNVTRKKLVGTV